jgi:Rrf2 family protein
MRISAKGRYALAAAIELAREFSGGASTTVISIAERLGISKIYLEQVFALLKRGEIVSSQKGAQGGYLLTRPPREISAYDVLLTVETALFQKTEPTAPEKAPQMDAALDSLVFDPMDAAVREALSRVSLEDLVMEAQTNGDAESLMFFI